MERHRVTFNGTQAGILALAVAVAVIHALARPFPGLDSAAWGPRLAARWQVHPDLRELGYSVDRLDLTVTGWIDDESEREAVAAAIQDVLPAGRSRVRDEIQVRAAGWLVVEKDGDRVFLHGETREFGDEAWFQGKWDISDQREAHPGVTTELWDKGIGPVARAFLEGSLSGTLEVREERLFLAGVFADAAARTRVREEAAAAWGTTIRITDHSELAAVVPPPPPEPSVPDLPVQTPPKPDPKPTLEPVPGMASEPSPPPPVPGPELSLRREGLVIVLDGKVPNYEVRAAVEAAVREQEPDLAIRNRIEVDESLPEAAWLGSFSDWWPELVRRIPQVTVEIGSQGAEVSGGPAGSLARQEVQEIATRIWGKQVTFRSLAATP